MPSQLDNGFGFLERHLVTSCLHTLLPQIGQAPELGARRIIHAQGQSEGGETHRQPAVLARLQELDERLVLLQPLRPRLRILGKVKRHLALLVRHRQRPGVFLAVSLPDVNTYVRLRLARREDGVQVIPAAFLLLRQEHAVLLPDVGAVNQHLS